MPIEAILLGQVAREMAADLPDLNGVNLIINGAKYYFSGQESMNRDRKDSDAMCHLEHCRILIREIEKFYDGIPFEIVGRINWYKPLVVTRELLPRFREAVESFYAKRDEASLRNLEAVGESLVENANSYKSNLLGLMAEIEITGNQRFTVQIRDNLLMDSNEKITQA